MIYIVATPIGNLNDISLRAISVLNSSDLILVEDTRITKVLLNKYNINKPLVSYHQHSKLKKINEIINFLKEGKIISLVCDAGTPGINDPGNFLIQEILKSIPNIRIVPIPGPNAAITALSASGFPSDKFVFLGFPPHKKGRQSFFKNIGKREETIVFYESKYRIIKTLRELAEISEINERPIVVARELTKQFEAFYRGTINEVLEQLSKIKLLGEFVIVIRSK